MMKYSRRRKRQSFRLLSKVEILLREQGEMTARAMCKALREKYRSGYYDCTSARLSQLIWWHATDRIKSRSYFPKVYYIE